MEHVRTRLTDLLESLPADSDPTVFAVRSHAVAAALYREGLVNQVPSYWHTDSIEIARTGSASVVLARYRAGYARSARLAESDRHTTLLNVGPGSLDVLVYRTVEAENGTARERQLLEPLFRTLGPGEVVAAVAGREIIDVIPTEETVAAWILSAPLDHAVWEFDRHTGCCIGLRKVG